MTETPKHGSLLEKVKTFAQIDDFSRFFAKWGTFRNFLLKSWPTRRNTAVSSKKLQLLAKSTIFHTFSRNEALFPTFCLKGHPNAKTRQFARKSCTFWPNRRFFMLFREMRHFLQLFCWKVDPNAEIWWFARKSSKFGQIDDFSCFFPKWGTFCNFLLKSWLKRRNMVVCSKNLHILAKSTIFHAFSRNEALFATFCWKVDPNAETWWSPRKGCTFLPNRRFFMLFRKMRHFLILLAAKLTQTLQDRGLLEKVPSCLAKLTIFNAFSRNEAVFATFCWKVDANAETSWFARKSCKFWPNRRFFMLFREMKHFLKLLLKSWPKRPHMVVCSKKLHILAKSTIFHAFSGTEAFSATFCWKVEPNAPRSWLARKSCTFWPNRRFFMLFRELRHFLQLFAEKFTQTLQDRGLLEKVARFGQMDDSSCFFPKWGTFCNFFLKSWPKRRHMVVCSKKLQVLAKSTIFHALSRNEALFETFCWKVDPNAETWWFARKSCTFWPNRRFFMVFSRN